MNKYRAAIIGLGRMGHTIDAEVVDFPAITLPYSIAASLREIPEMELVAGCDRSPSRRTSFGDRWGVTALYEDARRMLEEVKPDLVAVCTPGETHAELAITVAEAGTPMLYLEKAIACSMRDADRVKEAVTRNRTAFNTGVLRRFDTRYHHAQAIIATGDIGEPRAAVHYAETNLLHGHIHSVDTLMFLLGDPRAVAVYGELRTPGLDVSSGRLDVDPAAIYRIEFENGVEATTVPAGNWDFEVLGTQGVIRGNNNGVDWQLRRTISISERYRTVREVPWFGPTTIPISSTVFCLRDLVRGHETRTPTLGNVEVTHHATEICFAVAESHRRGGARVELPLQDRDLHIYHF
jgi:predicted dehydrogenase